MLKLIEAPAVVPSGAASPGAAVSGTGVATVLVVLNVLSSVTVFAFGTVTVVPVPVATDITTISSIFIDGYLPLFALSPAVGITTVKSFNVFVDVPESTFSSPTYTSFVPSALIMALTSCHVPSMALV